MRILVLTVVHDPEDARIRHRQIPALLAAGHKVLYAAPFAAFDRTPPAGVIAHDLPCAQGRRRLHAVRQARKLVRRLAASADVVLVHDPDLILAIAGQRRGPAYVWDVHEDTAAALSMRPWVPKPVVGILGAIVRGVERLAESRYHLLLAEPGYQKRFTRSHPVVPNTVRVPEVQPPAPGPNRVVYLGKITAARGGHDLIEVARQVPHLHFEVIGPAEADVRSELEQADSEGLLTWTGFVPNSEALQRLSGALAGVSLLHDEPNYRFSPPTKVMEYMAHGLPVITTPNPASADLVHAGDCGAVVDFGDTGAVAQALNKWHADASLRTSLGERAYSYAKSNLDWGVGARELVRALESFARG